MEINEFIKELEKINIILNNEQLKQLNDYYILLKEWNNKINLTNIIEEKDVYLKHFYDSLTLVKIYSFNNESICDVGTGAGFPGIVLKIVFPNLKVTLIDSLNKRITFLQEVIKQLNLKDIEAIHTRMEDYSKKNIEKFDCITSRAVADIRILTEISVQSLKINGYFLLMKANCEDELSTSVKNIENLGCNLENKELFKLPIENSNRTLIKIKKNKKTNFIYPRPITRIKKDIVKN